MPARPPGVDRRRSPLIVTADPDLLDELLRLHADVGLIADVAIDPAGARPIFGRAPIIFIGTDVADACARAGLRHRSDVILVGRDPTGRGAPPDWAAADRLGAAHIAMLPDAEPWLLERLVGLDGRADGAIVAVLGGCGGAGASVLAGGLAMTAARHGLATMLIDADPLGGGVDLVLGWEHRDGLRWPALSGASGRVPAGALVDSLPGRGDLAVLSWDRGEPKVMPVEAMGAALDAGRRGRDLVVADLSRQLDEAAIHVLGAADVGYLVVPAEVRACAAAARVVAIALPHCPGLTLVVRQPTAGGLSAMAVADAVGLPLAGVLRTEPALRTALERGEPPTGSGRGSLAALCDQLITDITTEPMEAAA